MDGHVRSAWIILVTYIIVALLAGFWLKGFASSVWVSWVEYKPPNATLELVGVEPEDHPADRVVVILVDGARPDYILEYASTASGYSRILRDGVWYSNAYAYTPSYSVPARASMSTGLPHEVSGVTSNWYKGGEPPYPSIFSLAYEEGLRIAVVGDSIIKDLFGRYLDVYIPIEEDSSQMERAISEAIKLLESDDPPDLLWVSLVEVDEAGHEYGAASQEYRNALVESGDLIGELLDELESLDMLEDTLVIIVSDHGHLDTGGHGGSEEEVTSTLLALIGAGIDAGKRVDRKVTYASVAPTVAFALGLPSKLVSYNPPLVEAFDAEYRDDLAVYTLQLARNLMAHLESLSTSIGYEGDLRTPSYAISRASSAIEAEDYDRALDYGLQAYMELLRYYNGLKESLSESGLPYRLAALALILGFLAASGIISRKIGFRVAIASAVSGLVGLAVFYAVFTIVEGYHLTMSSVNELGDYVTALMASSVSALVVAGVSYAILERRMTPDARAYGVLLSSIILVALILIWVYVTLASYGAFIKFPFPDWRLAFLYYTSLVGCMFTLMFVWVQILAYIVASYGLRRLAGTKGG